MRHSVTRKYKDETKMATSTSVVKMVDDLFVLEANVMAFQI